MNAAVLTNLFESMSEETQGTAVVIFQALADMDRKRRVEKARLAFEKVDALLDGDTGWATEEEMIADLAEFRRQNEGL